jgi:hypothetical protein
MSSQSENLSRVGVIEENSVNSSASKSPDRTNTQDRFELLETAKGRNFLEFNRDAREVSRFYVNGGPNHVLTVRWSNAVMGESIHVFAAGKPGPTIIALSDYKGPGGQVEQRVDEVWVKGEKGKDDPDVVAAIDHIEEIFPEYTLVTETVVDASGAKFVDGVLQEYKFPDSNAVSNNAIPLSSGEPSSLTS